MALLSFESMNHEWKQRKNDWEKERSGFTIEKQKESCQEKQFHIHNHVWRVAHQISLHAQKTDRYKCGGRITVWHENHGRSCAL